MKLTDIISELLKTEGYKQVDLARKLNMPKSTLSMRITRGDIDDEIVRGLSELVNKSSQILWEILTENNDQSLKSNDVFKNKIKVVEEENIRLKEEIEKLKNMIPSLELEKSKVLHYQEVIKSKEKNIEELERIVENQRKLIDQNTELVNRMKKKIKNVK